jgi:hypothetical protein
MNQPIRALLCSAALLSAGAAVAQAVVGQPAPALAAAGVGGKPASLDAYKGKYVVLEWTNPECPFVGKHYNSGNMPATQKSATSQGVVWLAVNTTDKADATERSRARVQSWIESKGGAPTATLIDDGSTARAYGARTTPHMYIVDPQGKVVYAGAIDSKPTANPADIQTATNFVKQALNEAMSGKPISRGTTQPYGCSVKYSNAG